MEIYNDFQSCPDEEVTPANHACILRRRVTQRCNLGQVKFFPQIGFKQKI